MSDLLAIAFSDLHYHDWNKFNDNGKRTLTSLEIIGKLKSLSDEYEVPLLFTGDFFHKQSGLSNELLDHLTLNLPFIKPPEIIGITGNHDQSQINTYPSQLSPSLYQSLCRIYPAYFKHVDLSHIKVKVQSLKKDITLRIYGIPYLTYNRGFNDALQEHLRIVKTGDKVDYHILLIHTNLHGATETDGRKMAAPDGIPENMDKYFKDFDWILCGHIHKPQKLGKHIINIGSPNQQKSSDHSGKFGYWKIYNDKAVFKEFEDLPKFKFYNSDEGHPETHDYWVPIDDIRKDTEEDTEVEEFTSSEDRGELAKKYCEARNIKSLSKINTLTKLLTDDTI